MHVIQFTRPAPVTNARCCSDPRTMCWRCAEAARLEEWEEQLPLPGSAVTENAGSPTRPSATDHLAVPNTIDFVVNFRSAEPGAVRDAIVHRRQRR